MTRVHFEIGHIHTVNEEEGIHETESVFSADTLSECIEEFQKRKYDLQNYFIDVWETKENDIPYPIADIRLDTWIFPKQCCGGNCGCHE